MFFQLMFWIGLFWLGCGISAALLVKFLDALGRFYDGERWLIDENTAKSLLCFGPLSLVAVCFGIVCYLVSIFFKYLIKLITHINS